MMTRVVDVRYARPRKRVIGPQWAGRVRPEVGGEHAFICNAVARSRSGRARYRMTFDVIIIGSGQAGVPLATRLAAAGKRVLIAERGALGGTCVNTGCTPTKTMMASARAAHVARTSDRLGVHAKHVEVDFAAIVKRKDEIVRRCCQRVTHRHASDHLTVALPLTPLVGLTLIKPSLV